MNDQEQVWSVRRAAAVLSEGVNRAERFADVKSAILDFLTAMDVIGNGPNVQLLY